MRFSFSFQPLLLPSSLSPDTGGAVCRPRHAATRRRPSPVTEQLGWAPPVAPAVAPLALRPPGDPRALDETLPASSSLRRLSSAAAARRHDTLATADGRGGGPPPALPARPPAGVPRRPLSRRHTAAPRHRGRSSVATFDETLAVAFAQVWAFVNLLPC